MTTRARASARQRRPRRTAGRARRQPVTFRKLGTIVVVGSIVAIAVGAGLGLFVRGSVESITPTATPPRTASATPTIAVVGVPPASATNSPAPNDPKPAPTTPPPKPTDAPKPAPTATQPPASATEPPAPTEAPAKPSPAATTPPKPSPPVAEDASPGFVWISEAPQTLTKGQKAVLRVQTLPNSRVTLSVLYGTAREAGIQPVRADGSGLAEFRWTVSDAAPAGPGRFIVSAQVRDSVVTAERAFAVE